MALYVRYTPILLGGGGGSSTGVTSLGPFGSTPNAEGGDISGTVLTLEPADGTHPGGVSITTQTFAGQKTFSTGLTGTLTGHATLDVATSSLGNLTDAGTDGIIVTGGTGAVVGTVSLAQHVADSTHNGYLSSTDWSTFNNKQPSGSYLTAVSVATSNGFAGSSGGGTTPILTLSTTITGLLLGNGTAISAQSVTNLTDVGTDGITITNGAGAVLGPSPVTLSQHVADTTHNGYLSSTDWNTFNGKQASGNYITALTGDVTASGPGSSVASLVATTNATLTTISSLVSVGTITTGTWSATTIALNKGGTGQTTKAAAFDALSPMTTGGDLIYGGSAGTGTRLANGSVNQYLASAGTTAAPVWTSFAAPTIQKFTSTGTQSGWLFTVTSANATVGATYTNNSNTYTVLGTIVAGTQLWMSGTGATSGGTLTKSGGTGDSTITFSSKVATATYTTSTSPRTPLYLKIKGVGAGGGGAGSGTASSSSNGTAGTLTGFGANVIVGNGGGGAVFGSRGATGGTATLSNASGLNVAGGNGSGPSDNLILNSSNVAGGCGGVSMLGGGGGAGPGGTSTGTESNAMANSGSGGGGGGSNGQVSSLSGGGGGAGGGFDALISSPATTYPYVIGAGGAGGSAGTSGFQGGAGADGLIIVEEHYQ